MALQPSPSATGVEFLSLRNDDAETKVPSHSSSNVNMLADEDASVDEDDLADDKDEDLDENLTSTRATNTPLPSTPEARAEAANIREEFVALQTQDAVLALELNFSDTPDHERIKILEYISVEDPKLYFAYVFANRNHLPPDEPCARKERHQTYKKDSDYAPAELANGRLRTIKEVHRTLFPDLVKWDRPSRRTMEDKVGPLALPSDEYGPEHFPEPPAPLPRGCRTWEEAQCPTSELQRLRENSGASVGQSIETDEVRAQIASKGCWWLTLETLAEDERRVLIERHARGVGVLRGLRLV